MSALAYVSNNDLQLLKKISHLAYHSKQYDLEEVDNYGNTALLKACFLGRLAAVTILLFYGASIKALNYCGQNALTLATYSGNELLVMELLKYRSYSDFNLSSLIPARCVATLWQHQRLMRMFKEYDRWNQKDVVTAHGKVFDLCMATESPGLSSNDIQTMISILNMPRH